MKILVTGSNGFIGQHLLKEIDKRGYKYVPFDRHVFGDVRDKNMVFEYVSKVDGVINLAGILGTQETINDPIPSVQTNIIGALNVFNACKEHNKPAVQIDVGNYFMNNSYSITKSTAGRFAFMYNKEHDTKIAVVRGLNAYGPNQKSYPVRKVIPSFIERALENKDIEVYGNGEQIMDMIYVEDIAKILLDALVKDHGVYNKAIDAGNGRKTTVNWLAEQVVKACNSKSKIVHVPMRPGETKGSVVLADPDTLKLLGDYDLVPFEEGIKKTVSSYKHENN